MRRILENLDEKRQDDLTVEELKQYPVFSSYSEQQAQELIKTLIVFTRIVFGIFTRKTNLNIL